MMIYRRSRYDILLNRPGCLIQEEDPKRYFIVYGPRRSGKTTYLINHMKSLPEEDNTCFISDFAFLDVRNRQLDRIRGVCASPEQLGTFRGTLFDWIYFDDVNIVSVLTNGHGLLGRAKKGVYVTTSEKDYGSFINQDHWKIINLEALL